MNKNTPEVTSFDVFRQQQEATWDVNNALKSLGGKVIFSNSGKNTFIEYEGKTLQLPLLSKKDGERVHSLIESLIAERSVCEARMYLARECKAEVGKKGVIPLYDGPDIIFNSSPFHLSTAVFPYELLPKTDQPPRALATAITDFINKLPNKDLVPLSVIERSPYSYTQSKKK